MKRGYLLAIIIQGVVLLLFTSCEQHEYYDSIKNDSGVFYCYSEGEKHEVSLRDFVLCQDNLVYNDTITLDDAVQTSNTGFIIERSTLLGKRYAGNYEICHFLYKAYFIVYIISYAHEYIQHYLPFEFEASEIWLDGEPVISQPFVFEKGQTDLTEEKLPEDGDFYARYLLKFPMTVYYKYTGQQIFNFSYLYQVMRSNSSIWNHSNPNISIHVTYNYDPELVP